MKYKIEFELPDNETVLSEIKTDFVEWAFYGYSGLARAKPVKEKKKTKAEREAIHHEAD